MAAESIGRPLRRDAEDNRQRVLAAAVTVLLRGQGRVSMASIAKQAGVGVATLYRRYPTREDLMEALQLRSFELVLALVEEVAVRELSGIDALRMFLEGTVAHGEQLVMTWHGAEPAQLPRTRRLEQELHGRVAALVEQATMDGTVRADLEPRDLLLFAAMVAQPLPNTSGWDRLARRQVELFLDGVRGPGAAAG